MTNDLAISQAQMTTLRNSLYPGASAASVDLVIAYCQARSLDPMKKPCHIVPMWVKDAETGQGSMRDVIMPGIYELRTTAQKTGDYVGQDDAEFGDEIEHHGIRAPAWCTVRVHRFNEKTGQVGTFSGTVRFEECCGYKMEGKGAARQVVGLNDRWSRAPYQMSEKCAEAAALRKAFPDELGGEMSMEEMADQAHVIDSTAETVHPKANTAPPERKAEGRQDLPPKTNPEPSAPVNGGQVRLLEARIDGAGIPLNDFCQAFNVSRVADMKFAQINQAMEWIKDHTEEPPG